MAQNAHDFSFINQDGSTLALKDYSGKFILVVNTASQCGFTKQYKDLETLWQMFKDKNLLVIAVPSNNFGGQEPGTNEEIKEFCTSQFNITFPVVKKVDVIGDNAHPFYKWAATTTGFLGSPKWNFHKFLIGPDGELVDYFVSTTSPTSTAITSKLQ